MTRRTNQIEIQLHFPEATPNKKLDRRTTPNTFWALLAFLTFDRGERLKPEHQRWSKAFKRST